MAKSHLSALDAEIIRSAFHNEVHEKNLPESKWRQLAVSLVKTYTGSEVEDPEMVEWIMRKSPRAEGDRR